MKRKLTFGSIIQWTWIACFVSLFIAPSTFYLLREKWTISYAVAHAKSIRLEHYRNVIDTHGREEIIATKDLAPKDFHLVSNAFPVFLDIGFPGDTWGCLFNPHHRIIITDAAGNITTIRVCFECDHIDTTHGNQPFGNIIDTPYL